MTLNLEPIGLPNVPPTPLQSGIGHAAVGFGVAVAVHATGKVHPVISIGIGVLAAYIHAEMDAPVSQVIAGAWAALPD
jgi:hypothetical protein